MATRYGELKHWQWAIVLVLSAYYILFAGYASVIGIPLVLGFWYGMARLGVYLNWRLGEEQSEQASN